MSALHDFATWEPLLRILRGDHAAALAEPGGYVAGSFDRHGYSLPLRWRTPQPGGATPPENRAQLEAAERVRGAIAGAGIEALALVAEIPPCGRAVLRLFDHGAAVESPLGNAHPGALLLVEGAVPEPWRRLPEAVPGAGPAPSADPALLERTLRERIPDAIGATEEEIAAAEARLGVALPEEVRALYRVTRARWEDWDGDFDAGQRVDDAVGFELFHLDRLAIADASSRSFRWGTAATEAAGTAPGAAVQGLVGSPGWIVIGDTGGGGRVAVDLTPGPRGHHGQVIVLAPEWSVGADLLAESLTDQVLHPDRDGYAGRMPGRARAVVRLHGEWPGEVEAAAHPDLEVLTLGGWRGDRVSLAPVAGLPRLRTLCAGPGALADPLEIARLTGLEFLELPPEEWRALLDAGAVPRGLSAAEILAYTDRDPRAVVALANELLALRHRPLITETVVEGELGPLR
ncbi:SMI1/KNR4 family protein [Kitasatospora sp. NPDC101176]|uniref:SMI1/KNR4 family protein n=1 Tax=Kitasatospora sp. NPDC101176 TaxID=3364099 RepID=UPI00380234A4